jgi:6-phosphofructokinase 1
VSFLRGRAKAGKNAAVIVVAEGAKIGGTISTKKRGSASSEAQLGGAADRVMAAVKAAAKPDEFEMRVAVLGHIQRGGGPNAEDHIISRAYGVAAIDAVRAGKFGCMVSMRGNRMSVVPIAEATGALKLVKADDPVYEAAKKIGVYMG